MKSITNYLDELKTKYGSDYRSAKIMGITRSSINTMRKRKQLSDENAIKIADCLEIKREELLIQAAIARSEGEIKKAWERIAQNSQLLGAIFVLNQWVDSINDGVYCLLCKINERFNKWNKADLI
jgi:plasmid maintenance system antidote protein VapI